MKEEPLHPWIEPELEARITALVLGEASDFEREELEHLIKEKAELALFRKRTESLHGLLQEIATGESADDNDDWKLSDEKRKSVLAVIDGDVEAVEESVVTEAVTKPKGRRGSFLKTITQIAAVLFFVALIAGLMMPAAKFSARSPASRIAAHKSEESEDAYFPDTASASSIKPPTADYASVAQPDHRANSKSSLSAIQDSLGSYAAVASEQKKGATLDGSLAVGYDTAYRYKGGRDNNDLSFPDVSGKPAAPRPTLAVNSAASSIAMPEFDEAGDSNDALLSLNTDVGQGIGMAMKTPASSTALFAAAGEGTEMAAADPFATPVRDGLAEKQANMALGKSSTFDEVALVARKPQAPGNASDKMHMGRGQASPIPITGLIADLESDDTKRENTKVTGGTFGSQIAATEQMAITGKKEVSRARELTERKSVSARGQISARDKMKFADTQQNVAGTLRDGRNGGFAKTKAKQDSDAFAANTPAKSVSTPAVTPMPALKGEVIARADVSKNQKTQDRVSRRALVSTDSPHAAEENVAMEMVVKKKMMNKESRANHPNQIKSRAEMKSPKQIAGREMTVGNRSRQSLVKGDAIDSLLESEKMSRDVKGNKDAEQVQAFAIASDSINGLISPPQSLTPKIIPAKKSAPPTGLNEKNAEDEAFSTFSLHVSDVSFKLAQAALAKGEWPDASKVRIEEFVNAFDYGDPMPNQNEKVASQMEQSIHPFIQQRNLLRVSMRTAAAGRSGDTPLRLTFLLDNSGSMERSDRQQTVQRAFALLAQQLQPMDQVTLISFARQPRLLADKVSGSNSNQLVNLVSNIPSEGGTNLEAALKLAFEKAQEQQVDNAQNRIIMLTDGAANLGNANPENLSKMIEGMRDAGIAFDAAGIGADGLNDEILEALTRKGDGRYYLLDQPEDADEGFARQIAGALRPAAKNVKLQIEFNPKRVGNYKLLGFEKHRLKKEDFRNDKVDAAEMAAEEAGVAVYQFEAKPDGEGDVGSVSVRFRDMSTGQMVENRWPIPYEADAPRIDQAAPSLRIASTAALLAAKLKGEPLGGSVELQTLSNLISALPNRQRNNKRVQQLQQMINQARQVSGK